MQPPDYLAEYLALRAANDQLRQRGQAWLFDAMEKLCAERNREFLPEPATGSESSDDSKDTNSAGSAPSANSSENGSPANSPPMIQIGRQPWQFKVGNSTMIGERLGLRYRMNTLVIEVGWPREAEHGHVPSQGLARGRIGLSRNPLIEPQYIHELILKAAGENDAAWHHITQQQTVATLTEADLHTIFQKLLAE
jgi:hypothetical protein